MSVLDDSAGLRRDGTASISDEVPDPELLLMIFHHQQAGHDSDSNFCGLRVRDPLVYLPTNYAASIPQLHL